MAAVQRNLESTVPLDQDECQQNVLKRWPNKQALHYHDLGIFFTELQGLAKWKERSRTIFVALAPQTELKC